MNDVSGGFDGTTFNALVDAAAAQFPDRVAVVFPDERVTYAELAKRIDGLSRALVALGVQPGDSVATLMPNCVDHITAIFATTKVGALSIPINTRFRSRELSFVIKNSGAKVILTSTIGSEFSNLPQRLTEAISGQPHEVGQVDELKHIALLGGGEHEGMLTHVQLQERAELIDQQTVADLASQVDRDDLAIMIYTSGTTSTPKGVALAHRQFTSIGIQIANNLGARDGDKLWDALPMFHSSAILPMLATFSVAGTFISQATPEPQQSIEMIQREGATLLWPAFTQIWQAIVAQPGFAASDLRHVRAILCIGPFDTVRHLESQLPTSPLLSCYGITEGSGVPTMVRWDDAPEIRQGSGGFPFEGIEATVVGQDGLEAPANTVGELKIRGTNVFSGYWHDQDLTDAVFDEAGWFSTGDLCTRDEEGRISYQGRTKDMLKVGGENVAALEIEAHLSTHPDVQTVAVVGAPDEVLVEVPAAFIELKPGKHVTEDELQAYCVGQIASFKVPRYFRFVTEWPMSATKIRKVDLTQRIAEELQK